MIGPAFYIPHRTRSTLRALLAFVLVMILLGCAAGLGPRHNAAGGYVPACGPSLPGLIGDDC